MPTDTWSSLRRRLPLLLSGVLCIALVGVCIGAYFQLRSQLARSASERVLAATQQVANLLDGQLWRVRTSGAQLARTPEIAAILAKPDAESASRLHDRYFPAEGTRNSTLRAFSVLDRRGRLLARADSAGSSIGKPGLVIPTESDSNPARPVKPGVSALYASNGSVGYRVVDPLVSRKGDTLGYAVLEAQVADTAGARRISGLIGPGATMLIGNNSGDLWTDTHGVVSGPPVPLGTTHATTYSDGKGNDYDAAKGRLSAAAWSVVVQMPHGQATQPARKFLYAVVVIALLLFLLGVLAAFYLSRQVTTPLADFSTAAEEFASGDYGRRITISRNDELGSMASAFNAMAEKVEHATLEREHHERDLEAANTELRESETRYRQLVELSPDGILVHRGGIVQFANPAAVRMFGAHTTRDLVQRPVMDLVPPENREAVSARVARLVAGQEPMRTIEQTLRRLDGTSIQTETIAMGFQSEGQTSVLSIIRDVTARKRLEDQLRQSQKMEAVGQLAGGVAHDFNNLLTVIITYGELLISTRGNDEELVHDLREILGAAERAAGLTRQLLAFSRRQLLQPKVVDLSQLTIDLQKMLGRLLPENIELVTMLAKPLGYVSADAGQIEQVVLNLIVNARDAMPDGGRIVIETKDVDLEDDSPLLPAGGHGGPFVLLSVTDSGHGMDEETRLKIFDPFFTTKEPGKGTGLGLSTVYGIVKQSGGSINVYSEPGIGTTFKIYLPRVFSEPAVVAPKRNPLERSGSETILLVEDDARVRGAAERVLRNRGYTVITATNGADALEVASRHKGTIDLMITDLVMPAMGGRELAQKLALVRPATKVLFMSGYTEDAASRSSLMDPGAVFLGKPFTPDSLTTKVRETLHGEQTVAV